MATAYLGLGTNVGNKRGNLVTAAALLAERVGDVLALSDMYETEPWGFESDNTFLNAVIVMTTELSWLEAFVVLSGSSGNSRHIDTTQAFEDGTIDRTVHQSAGSIAHACIQQ